MKSEKEKMLAGELYHASDEILAKERLEARITLQKFNSSKPDETEERARLLKKLIGKAGQELWIEPPFYCDYGYNIELGDQVYFNFNCVLLDVNPIRIGDFTLVGPQVQIYTATHPLDWKTRSKGLEFAKPVIIGDHVWIGGGSIVNPGISIGSRSIIGSGSVVTKDIPADVFAAGNPCRVIRKLAS